MDNFAEQLVKRNETSSERTRRTLLTVFGSLFVLALIVLSILQLTRPAVALMGFLLAAAAGYGIFFTVQNSYVEYEYAFTNGELDIDKIIAKKKRSPMISTEVKSFTTFGKYSDDIEETIEMTVVIASDNIASHEYYAEFEHEEYGSVRLIFAPNERMLENIKKFLPAKLRNELNQ